MEMVGISSLVHQNQVQDSHCKIFDKLNCNIVKDNLEDCHRLKGDRVIVKFSKKKDCNQVLSVKNDLKNINMADFGFEGNGSIYINNCSYYKVLWSWSKKLHNMGRIYSWFLKIYEHGDFVSVTHTYVFIKHFPDVDCTAFHNRK